MVDKLVISEYTHRTLAAQKAAHPDKPAFVLPDDMEFLLRPTTRKENPTFHCVSLAVLARNEKDFREFVARVWHVGGTILSDADDVIVKKRGIAEAVRKYKVARKEGAALIGAAKSAQVRAEQIKIACDAIKDEWPLPNSVVRTPVLQKKAGAAIGKKSVHYRTLVARLGSRPIAQHNYRAAQKRKERHNAKQS